MAANPTRLTSRESVAVWLGTAVWTAGLLAAVLLTVAVNRPASWLAAGAAAVAVAGLIAVAVAVARAALRRDGVERAAYVEASALAFWITMGSAFTYGLVDSFAGVPPIRMPWLLALGLLTWPLTYGARLNRYR
jgi:hypothetical protein